MTYIKYNKVRNIAGISFRTEIVAKGNHSRLNRHQQVQPQGWRANTDNQLITDQYPCVEYLAKYTSKAEKISSVT